MIYGLALCLYVLCYVFVQIMFLFYGCHVSQHKRKVFIILVAYTILFKGMDFLLNSPDPSAISTTTYWTYWAVHTLDTFILITLMAVYADGTLGRNWVKLFFYYDLVTIGANALVQNKLVLFLTDHHLVESATLFSATQPKDLLWIIVWAYSAAAIALVMVLVNKPLDRLISRIPENLCLLLMGIAFLTYIGKVLVMFLYQGEFFLFDKRYARHIWLNVDVMMVILLLITLYLLITVARQKRQLQRLQRLESGIQLGYYQNVSALHGSIRSLRHDLSNHLAVPEEGYRESLLRICKEIDGQIHRQLAWQTLDVPQLSSREKYEIYQYVQQLLQKKKLPTEALCITTEENQLSLAIDTTGRRPLHPALLRSSSYFRMLQTILKQHNGTATWQKGENSCTLHLHF